MSGSPTRLVDQQSQYPRMNSNSAAERRNRRYVEKQTRSQLPRKGETRPSSHATIHDQAEHESIHQKPRIISKDSDSYSPSSSSFCTRDIFSRCQESIGNQRSKTRNNEYPTMSTELNGGSCLPTSPEEFYRPKDHIGGLSYPEIKVHYPPPPDMSHHQDLAGDGPTAGEGRCQGQYEHGNYFGPPPIPENQRSNRYKSHHVDSEHARNCTHYEDRSQNRMGGDCGPSGCNVELNYQGHTPGFQFSRHRPPWQSPVHQNCRSNRYSGQRHDMFLSHYDHRCCPNGEHEMREVLREMREMIESLQADMEAERRANDECRQRMRDKMKEKVEAENRAATIARAADIKETVSLIQAMLEQKMKQCDAQQAVTQTYTEQGRPWIGPWGGPVAGMQFKTAGRHEAGWPGIAQPSQLFMHPSAQPFITFGPTIDHQSIRQWCNDARPFEEVLPVPPVVPQPPGAIFNAGGDDYIFGSLSNKSSNSDRASSLPHTQSWQYLHQKLQRQKAAYEALEKNKSPQSTYANLFATPSSSGPIQDWSQPDASQSRGYKGYYDEQSYHL